MQSYWMTFFSLSCAEAPRGSKATASARASIGRPVIIPPVGPAVGRGHLEAARGRRSGSGWISKIDLGAKDGAHELALPPRLELERIAVLLPNDVEGEADVPGHPPVDAERVGRHQLRVSGRQEDGAFKRILDLGLGDAEG